MNALEKAYQKALEASRKSRGHIQIRSPIGQTGFPKVSMDELIRQTKTLWEEAYKADPYGMDELIKNITHSYDAVFNWSSLTRNQLTRMRRSILATVMSARG